MPQRSLDCLYRDFIPSGIIDFGNYAKLLIINPTAYKSLFFAVHVDLGELRLITA